MRNKLETRNSKLETRNSKFKIIALVGIAVLLLVGINNQQKAKTSPAPSPQAKLMPSNLSEDEKFILNPPSPDASASAKQKHAQTVAKLALVRNQVEIKDCQPTPLVLQVKQGSEFTVKNSDNTSHTLTFDEDHNFKIPANGLTTIKAEFKYGTGDYGYVCEGVGLVGFLHIIP